MMDLNRDTNQCVHIKEKDFCSNCGVISADFYNCIKPRRYEYSLELYPPEILKNMISNLETIEESSLSQNYMNDRSHLVNFLRHSNSKLKFRSQTFFLAVYYMDIIFNSKITNYPENIELIALSCLILAAKFDENDPNIPDLYLFQTICSTQSKYKFYFTIEDLRRTEIACIKLLNYKLNYFTAYHFIIFFFTHGIVYCEELEKVEDKMKMVESIYSCSRDLLDMVTERGKKIVCHNNLHIACSIITLIKQFLLEKEKEPEMGATNADKNIFGFVYGIKTSEFEETYKHIKSVYKEYRKMKEENKKVFERKNLNIDNKNFEINYKNPNSYINFVNYVPLPISITKSKRNEKTAAEIENKFDTKLVLNLKDQGKPRATSLKEMVRNNSGLVKQSSNTSKNLNLVSNIKEIEDPTVEYLKTNAEKSSEVEHNFVTSSNNVHPLKSIEVLSSDEEKELKKPLLKITNIISPNDLLPIEEEQTERIVSPLNKHFEYKNIRRPLNHRVRTRNESYGVEFSAEKEDLLHKTKKVFGSNNTGAGNNIYGNSISSSTTNIHERNSANAPSTIIINNNININTFINKNYSNSKDINYLSSGTNKKLRNNLIELNYDKYYHKSALNTSSNHKAKEDYVGFLSTDKENIRKKIDYEILVKNKFSSGYSNNNYNDFYKESTASSTFKYEKDSKVYDYKFKNVLTNKNSYSSNFLKYEKFSKHTSSTNNDIDLQINYDYLKKQKNKY